MITVRHFGDDDLESLRGLVREVWSDRPPEVFDRRWWWLMRQPAPLFVAEDRETGRLIGMCAYVPFNFHANGVDERGAWFVDFFVSPEQQGKGVGKTITLEVMNRFPVTASLSQSDPAWAAFRKLGWRPRAFAKLYLHVAPSLWNLWPARGSSTITLVSEICPALLSPEVAQEIDNLWSATRGTYPALALRDSTTLQERYGASERRSYEMVRAYRGGQLIGYMISRLLPRNSLRSLRRLDIGLIADYLIRAEEAEVFIQLLRKATRTSLARGAQAMLCMAGCSMAERALRGGGYLHSSTPLIGRKLRSLDIGFTFYSTSTDWPDPSEWFLTLGDCDLDLLWGETPIS